MTLDPIDSPASLEEWLFPWPTFTVDWDKAGLLVIDVQHYCADPSVGLAKLAAERYPRIASWYIPRLSDVLIPNLRRLIAAFRDEHREVVYTRHGALLPDGHDMIARRRRRDADALISRGRPAMWARGTFEHQIIDEIAPLPTELVVDKNSSSPFNGTGIDQLLRNLGLETLVVTGLATDMCVDNTSRDAADRGYNVIVVEDATLTFYEKHHRNALSALARVFTQVWSTDQVLAALRTRPHSHLEASRS